MNIPERGSEPKLDLMPFPEKFLAIGRATGYGVMATAIIASRSGPVSQSADCSHFVDHSRKANDIRGLSQPTNANGILGAQARVSA